MANESISSRAIRHLDAPSARLTPISRVRSETATVMVLTIEGALDVAVHHVGEVVGIHARLAHHRSS